MAETPKLLKIAFVSTMSGAPWGGSEELWHGTAKRMRMQGHAVGVSVYQWPDTPRQVAELQGMGCTIDFRPRRKNLLGRLLERRFQGASGIGIPEASCKWLQAMKPDLVLISQGFPLEAISWMIACKKLGIRYASVIQAASEVWWPEDDMMEDLREAYIGAAGLYFVSKSNLQLMERQCGMALGNASVVSNPWNVNADGCIAWPGDTGMCELAFVGRMDPRAKGQDVLMEVLAMDKWRGRPLRVNFYGSGPCEGSVKRLAEMLGLANVRFHGQVSDIGKLWSANHALILPSRFEGLPLVIVEAMLCGRMVITTDIAGNAEYLTDGVNGFVAPAPAPVLLDQAMERAWEARGRWKEMGERARADVLTHLPEDPYEAFEAKLLSIS